MNHLSNRSRSELYRVSNNDNEKPFSFNFFQQEYFSNLLKI